MKCIKAIKETKSYQLGEIRRTEDLDADQKVASGVWKFISKSEWKENTRKSKPVEVSEEKPKKTSKKVDK